MPEKTLVEFGSIKILERVDEPYQSPFAVEVDHKDHSYTALFDTLGEALSHALTAVSQHPARCTGGVPGKWTKGPWKYSWDDVNGCFCVTSELGAICEVEPYWGNLQGYDCDKEQCEINVRLLTAAPDLAVVLEEMVAMMDCGDEHGEGSSWHIKAKAALAKANGEA